MEVVVIPFEYEHLSPAEQAAIIPICIKSTDHEGKPIDRGWFEAAAEVQDPLRALARFWLYDVWRVSEITEAAVHKLWFLHGHHLGRKPSSRVYSAAKWQAQDLRVGDWQSRRGTLQTFSDLEAAFRQKLLVDPTDYGKLYLDDVFIKDLAEQLSNEGLPDVRQMLMLLLDGYTWDQIGEVMGKRPDPARIRFSRWIKRLVSRASAGSSQRPFGRILE
jgi:hypothetical protein